MQIGSRRTELPERQLKLAEVADGMHNQHLQQAAERKLHRLAAWAIRAEPMVTGDIVFLTLLDKK